jgi:hypothetical protein
MARIPTGRRGDEGALRAGIGRIGVDGRRRLPGDAGKAGPVPVQTNLFSQCRAMKLSTETMESIFASSVLRNLMML